MQKKLVLKIIFLVLSVIASVVAWELFASIIVVSNASDFVFGVELFSVLGVLWFIGSAVADSYPEWLIWSGIFFLPGMFAFGWEQGIAALIAVALGWAGLRASAAEANDRLRYSFFRNAKAGAGKFLLALTLTISSGYYLSIRTQSLEELVPRFSLGEGYGPTLLKWVGAINPAFRTLSKEGTTVDGFLSDMNRSNASDALSSVPTEVVQMTPDGKTIHVPLSLEQRKQILDAQQATIDQQLYRSGEDQIGKLAGRFLGARK